MKRTVNCHKCGKEFDYYTNGDLGDYEFVGGSECWNCNQVYCDECFGDDERYDCCKDCYLEIKLNEITEILGCKECKTPCNLISFNVRSVGLYGGKEVSLWKCPNCGQEYERTEGTF